MVDCLCLIELKRFTLISGSWRSGWPSDGCGRLVVCLDGTMLFYCYRKGSCCMVHVNI